MFDGAWTPAASVITVTEPATGKSLGTAGMVDSAGIADAAKCAAAAQRDWAATSYEQRAAVLRSAARIAEEHAADIVDWLVRESGSTRPKAAFEAGINLKALHEAAGLPSRATGEVLPSTDGKMTLARRRPIGVVGIISPFNFPLYLSMRAVAPALALGNAVVLKPDPRTTVSGGFVIARIFELAGLPAGVLHVVPGDGAAGAAITSDPNISMVAFTGSTAAGRKVGEAAGKHLKKVSLELGGKNSLLILDDADLDLAVSNTAWGSYLHQGQICMATGRVLVHRSIYEPFLAKLTAKAKSLPVGDPATGEVALGPLINAHQRDHALDVVKRAEAAGATIEAGGGCDHLFFQPTVLSGVTPDNPAFHEEIFAPVAVVVPFDTDDEAVRLANDTDYGLSMGIITSDVGRALALSDRLQTGLLRINDQTVNDDVVNPFGGVGASGNGTSIGGSANWEEFTQWQWLTIRDKAPEPTRCDRRPFNDCEIAHVGQRISSDHRRNGASREGALHDRERPYPRPARGRGARQGGGHGSVPYRSHRAGPALPGAGCPPCSATKGRASSRPLGERDVRKVAVGDPVVLTYLLWLVRPVPGGPAISGRCAWFCENVYPLCFGGARPRQEHRDPRRQGKRGPRPLLRSIVVRDVCARP